MHVMPRPMACRTVLTSRRSRLRRHRLPNSQPAKVRICPVTQPSEKLLPCSPLFRRSKVSERVALFSSCWPSIGPLQDGVKRRTKGLAPWCQPVFNLRRYLRIGPTYNDSVRCQTAELLPQHFLSDVGYRSFQVGEAHHLASE